MKQTIFTEDERKKIVFTPTISLLIIIIILVLLVIILIIYGGFESHPIKSPKCDDYYCKWACNINAFEYAGIEDGNCKCEIHNYKILVDWKDIPCNQS